jgi:methionyl-tRNA formyltransferase
MNEKKTLKVVFMGTPEFAAKALEAILNMLPDICVQAVLTQPDRPAGRGMALQASAVKQLAVHHQLPVYQPISLRRNGKYPEIASACIDELKKINPDVMIVAAYGLILPQEILDIPRFGCINIHASLLPRWRGAAPIHRAIEAGDIETGVTLMQMDAGLDTGAMIKSVSMSIEKGITTGQLHDLLADLGAEMIVDALTLLNTEQNTLISVPQPDVGITYAEKIRKDEAHLDWNLSAVLLAQRICAFNPFPGAIALWPEISQPIKIWQAEAIELDHSEQLLSVQVGEIIKINTAGIVVACGNNTALILQVLQKSGGKRVPASVFLQSMPISVGAVLR